MITRNVELLEFLLPVALKTYVTNMISMKFTTLLLNLVPQMERTISIYERIHVYKPFMNLRNLHLLN